VACSAVVCFGVLIDVVRVLWLFLRFPLFVSIFGLFAHLFDVCASSMVFVPQVFVIIK
jgi:hypothetical protein